MSARVRWIILAFALIGLAFAGAAARVHYRLLTEPNYISPCDINAKFNCSEVYLSHYGTVHGVPVAFAGILWFGLVALLALFAKPQGAKSSPSVAGSYVFALATVGLAVILYLGYTSLFVLRTGCVLCIGTYVSVAAIFIASGASGAAPVRQLPGRLWGDLKTFVASPLPLFVTLAFVAGLSVVASWFPKTPVTSTAAPAPSAAASGSSDVETRFDAIWAAQPRIDLGVPANGAKVVVVKFNDWQCPSCKAAHYLYAPVLDKYAQTMPGVVKYVIKDYPLNSKCNVNVTAPGPHPGACEAAVAVRLAREHGKADEMIAWLFSNQETLTPPVVASEVKTMLGVSDFASAYARLIPEVERDVADGGALKVEYTPTYYVNGVKAQAEAGRWLTAPYFDYAIRYELRKAGVTLPGDSASAAGQADEKK